MIVTLGEQVVGKNGTLGRITGFRIDPNSQSADQMVIKHGLPFHGGHLAVLGFVTGVETGVVRVDLTTQELEELEQYSRGSYHGDELGGEMMPPFDVNAESPYEQSPDVPFGGSTDTVILPEHSDERLNDTHPMPPSYPAESANAPGGNQPVVITKGTDVFDNGGSKVGQVQNFAVETSTGQPTQITLERGIFGRTGCDLPVDQVQAFGPAGIVLRVAKDQVNRCE